MGNEFFSVARPFTRLLTVVGPTADQRRNVVSEY